MFREDVICQRCFRLKNYNEVQDVGMDSEDFKFINRIVRSKGIVVNVVDVFDFEDHSLTRLSELLEIKNYFSSKQT